MYLSTRNFIVLAVSIIALSGTAFAQPAEQSVVENRFSHKGVKAMVGSASHQIIAERFLEDGQGGTLGLGFGFSHSFSVWLQFTGSEHYRTGNSDIVTEFGGGELNLQYKFETRARLQPYGKLGFGAYRLQSQSSNKSLLGGGINLSFGLDFFFSRHFGIGAEVAYKKIDYYFENTETAEAKIIHELFPNLNGDTFAFSLTLTVQ